MDSRDERIRELEKAIQAQSAKNESPGETEAAALLEALRAANEELRSQAAERQRAEQALRVTLEKYRVLFESFPLGVTITDDKGQILEANRMSEELLGLTADQHAQRSIAAPEWQIVETSGRPLPPDQFASSVALRERRTVTGQRMGVTRGDGSVVWLDVSAAPIPLEGFGVAITYSDVSARVAAHEALRSFEQRYQMLFDHAAEGVALHELVRDASGRVVNYRIVGINRQYEAIVGLSAAEVVGRLGNEVYRTVDPPYLVEFSSAPLTGEPLRFETYFAPMDKHFSISVAPIGTEGFATIFFDVTDLRKSQQRHEALSALVESSTELVGMAALDGGVLYLNEAGRRLTGLAKDAPVSRLTLFELFSAEWRARLAERILPAVGQRGIWTGEAALLNRTTGAAVPADVAIFTIPARDTGGPLCLGTVIRDISERVRANEQRERLEGQLRQAQKMESIGRLAGGVAHDFNNLLTSILGNVELALDLVEPSSPIHPFLADVRKAGESAAALTRQLLAFSRKQHIEPRVLNLNDLLANMQRMLRRIIGEDVTLSAVSAHGVKSVRADASQVEQAIVNLAVNARDAMPDGGRLTISTADVIVGDELCLRHPDALPGSYVRLSVSDTGAGMDADTLSHLFEPFFTTKKLGTGLGLAMVYGAVVQNGGFVSVDSEPGRGTTVSIYLPSVEEAPAVQRSAAPTTAARGSGTILLVEDEPMVRELARRALSALGYVVLPCADGRQALEASAAHPAPIDLLLTDVVMPGMNGRELAAAMTAERPGIKVLFTSGHTGDVILHHGLFEEGLEFLSKPYTLQALGDKVRTILDRE